MKKLILINCIAFISFLSYGQGLKYHDVSPDTTINYWEVFGFYGIDIWWHPSPEVVVNVWDPYEVLCSTADTMPLALNAGDNINTASGLWAKVSYQCLNCGGSYGKWKGVTDKYLAFRKKGTSSGDYYYGWARLSIPANATSFTIKDYAQNNVTNATTTAGQVYGTGVTYIGGSGNSIVPVINNKHVSFRGLMEQAQYKLIDVSGKLISQGTISNNNAIDLSSYIQGLYIISLTVQGNEMVYKLPVE